MFTARAHNSDGRVTVSKTVCAGSRPAGRFSATGAVLHHPSSRDEADRFCRNSAPDLLRTSWTVL